MLLMMLGGRRQRQITIAGLFAGGEWGDYWDGADTSTLFQNSDGISDPVTAHGDLVGSWNGKRGQLRLIQANAANKPAWLDTGRVRSKRVVNDTYLDLTSVPTVRMGDPFFFGADCDVDAVSSYVINVTLWNVTTAVASHVRQRNTATGANIANGALAELVDLAPGNRVAMLNIPAYGSDGELRDGAGTSVAVSPSGAHMSTEYTGGGGRMMITNDPGDEFTSRRRIIIARALNAAEQEHVRAWLAGEVDV